MAEVKSKKLKEKLFELRRQEEESQVKGLAAKLNLPYLDLSILPIEPEIVGLLPEAKAKQAQLAIIQKKGQKIWLALRDPQLPTAQKVLKELKEKYDCRVFLVSEHSLARAWQLYEEISPPAKEIVGKIEISPTALIDLQKEIKNLEELKNKIATLPQAQISELLEILLAGAFQTEASDIHLETVEGKINIRYRIDGLLQDVVFLLPKTYHFLLSRIKLLSGMRLNIHDTPQDGRFTIRLGKTDIELRVSCLPSAYGENIVMRVLNPQVILDLKDLGLRAAFLQVIEKEIKKPNGMIINTGPTGSGKTTTLYACLKKVNQPGIKIITLEDPVEYHLTGISQTQIDAEKGYTFAQGLRAIVRQDPDVLLVGEIRDRETADIALNAALTGHLVFTTLHTNDAAGAIPRFIDLGAKAPILASALNLVVAQRLVRRLCQKCKESFVPDTKILEQIKKALPKQTEVQIPKELYRAQGCSACNQTGYKGRIGVFEIILVEPETEKLISTSPSHAQIVEMMEEKGLMTMYQDGLLKVLEGITSLEEVERVLKE